MSVLELCDHIFNDLLAGGGDGFDRPLAEQLERHHDAVREDAFGHGAERIARHHHVASLGNRGKVPLLVTREGLEVLTALQEEAAFFGKLGQRVLKTVKNLGQKAGAKFHGQKFAGEFHLVTRLEARGVFEHLEFGVVTADTDDFALERDNFGLAVLVFLGKLGISHFVLGHGGFELDTNQVTVDADDFSDTSH